MSNLVAILDNAVRAYPERTAIVDDTVRINYAEVGERVNKMAWLLHSRGVVPGTTVALLCPNSHEFTVAYYAILKLGAIVVPLNILLTAREITQQLRDSRATLLLTLSPSRGVPSLEVVQAGVDSAAECTDALVIDEPSLVDEMAAMPSEFHAVEIDSADTAVILYTSGTTGVPKGAELTHANLALNAAAGREMFDANASTPDVYLGVLPLSHVFGQTIIQNGAIAFAGTVILHAKFDAQAALAAMAAEQVSLFAGVPTMYWALVRAIDSLDSDAFTSLISKRLRVAIAGGSPLSPQIHADVVDRLGVNVLEGYGLSETSSVATFSPNNEPPRVGSIGKPIQGVELAIVDESGGFVVDPDQVGEIAIRGHNVMKGYWRNPEATQASMRGDWFLTGDLGRRDVDGFYYVVDRKKDLILRGGYNVYPREVEDVLMQHPAVSLVAVVGEPHASLGEEVKAVVVLVPNAAVSPDDLRQWSRERLARYKYPRLVEIRSELPLNGAGKIMKRSLR